MDVIILAAGRGTRMGALTAETPKPLLRVAGRPLLAHVLDEVRPLSPGRIVIVTHYLADVMRRWVAEHAPECVTVDQGRADGTARAVACAEPAIDAPEALVVNGDNYFHTADLAALAAPDGYHHVGVIESNEPWRYGVIDHFPVVPGKLEPPDLVRRIIEKPDPWEGPVPVAVSAGAYLFQRSIFPILRRLLDAGRAGWEERGQEIPLTDALAELASQRRLRSVRLTRWRDMGNPSDLEKLDRYLETRGRR